MLKNYLKLLKQICKKFGRKNKDVFDIVIYGSAVKGEVKSRDIDIIVIFLSGEKKERLSKAYEFKEILTELFKYEILDIKEMLVTDFFNPNFLAREGIILEGISLIKNAPMAKLFGFESFSLFSYNLKGISHTQKIKFNYALKGRRNKGILDILYGKSIGLGMILIPINYSREFETFLKEWKISYKEYKLLMK